MFIVCNHWPLINLFLWTLQKVKHQAQQLHLPWKIVQPVRQEIIQILIHCSFQETAYLNVLSGKLFAFKGEGKLQDYHTNFFFHISSGDNLTFSFLSVTAWLQGTTLSRIVLTSATSTAWIFVTIQRRNFVKTILQQICCSIVLTKLRLCIGTKIQRF